MAITVMEIIGSNTWLATTMSQFQTFRHSDQVYFDAAVSLLGISYDLWSLALFLAVGLALLTLLRRRGQGRIQ